MPDDSETLLMQGAIDLRLGRIDDVVTNLEKGYAVDNANGLLIYGLTFFLSDGRLESFRALEEAVRTVRRWSWPW